MSLSRVTLADIAAKAGVHVTTVSLSIRNHPRIPARTRRRIQKIAEEMGYTPDPRLQALVSYRSRTMERKVELTLGYLTNWNGRSGWQNIGALPKYYAGALAKSHELGFSLKHIWMREPEFSFARINKELTRRKMAGLIVASHTAESDEPLPLDWEAFPAVKIDFFPHQPLLHRVIPNYHGSIRHTFQRLLATGYRRIGFAMHRGWDHNVDYSWLRGLLCEQASINPSDAVPILYFPQFGELERGMAPSDSDAAVPTAAFKKWFQQYRPQVIISKWSFVERTFAESGLSVPRDVAFVDMFLENTRGDFAGIQQNHEAVGGTAVEILADQTRRNIKGVPSVAKTTAIDGTWFDGASCPIGTLGQAGPKRRRRNTESEPPDLELLAR